MFQCENCGRGHAAEYGDRYCASCYIEKFAEWDHTREFESEYKLGSIEDEERN